MIAIMIIPIYTLVESERKHLYDKRNIINGLHDELQVWILTDQVDRTWTKKIEHREVILQFNTENEWLKGCAYWTDVRAREQSECLYAYQ